MCSPTELCLALLWILEIVLCPRICPANTLLSEPSPQLLLLLFCFVFSPKESHPRLGDGALVKMLSVGHGNLSLIPGAHLVELL